MKLIICLIVVVVALATYLSTMNLALMGLSRAALQRRVTERGRPDAADWLHDKVDCAMLATALLRTLTRMAIYILVLAAWIDLGNAATVRWSDLIVAGLIAAAIIWFTTIVVATAIARHVGAAVIVNSLPILHAVTTVCYPATRAGLFVNQLVRRLSGSRAQVKAEVDLLESIEDTRREGGIDIQSVEILENVVEFTNKEVSQVMTPRADIEAIELTDDLQAIRNFITHAGHSRIPVHRGNLDSIVGILYVKDLLHYLGEDAPEFRLATHLRQAIVVPETKPVRELLANFQHSEVHMAIVIDEYGSTAGLVTIEDVLEEIVGEIRDEHDVDEDHGPVLKSIDSTHAEVDGRFRIDELNDRLHLNLPEDGEYDTVAGFVMSQLGRVPGVGESFESHRARFTALAASPTHVKRIAIELLPASPNGEPNAK